MSGNSFKFKHFEIAQDKCAMKIGTDSVLLGSWVNVNKSLKILDVGVGTGIISIMLAQRSDAFITGIEIDEAAFLQANENALNCPWHNRIKFYNDTFLNANKLFSEKFDLIISNPPFFNNSLKPIDEKRKNARHTDTLSFNELIVISANMLSKEGILAIIIPFIEKDNFINEAAKNGLFCIRKTVVKTNNKQEPKRIMMEFSNRASFCIEDIIAIYDENSKEYSQQYINLTKDFYL